MTREKAPRSIPVLGEWLDILLMLDPPQVADFHRERAPRARRLRRRQAGQFRTPGLPPETFAPRTHDACYIVAMGSPAESVKLDDDVHEELRKLSESSGRPLGALANDALRDFLRHERSVAAAIDRGVADLDAGRTRTTDEVLSFLEQQRLARGRG